MGIALVIIGGYLVGSVPFGVIVGRAWRGVDVRQYGSRNIGFSNVMRVLGPGPGLVVLAGDVLKGAAPVLVGRALLGAWAVPHADLWALPVALSPILGHSFSIFLRFRGGRGVATTLGVLFGMSWPAALIGLGIWLALVAATRYISVGSIVAAASVPVYMVAAGKRWEWWAFWGAVALLVILRHIPNMGRLLKGTEAKFGQTVPTESRGDESSEGEDDA